jgi:hypothetical protein
VLVYQGEIREMNFLDIIFRRLKELLEGGEK